MPWSHHRWTGHHLYHWQFSHFTSVIISIFLLYHSFYLHFLIVTCFYFFTSLLWSHHHHHIILQKIKHPLDFISHFVSFIYNFVCIESQMKLAESCLLWENILKKLSSKNAGHCSFEKCFFSELALLWTVWLSFDLLCQDFSCCIT